MITSLFGVLFDGFAYGMLLFLLSVGLSVTLGMMNFVNLAHCTFGMIGGYVTVTLINTTEWGIPAFSFRLGNYFINFAGVHFFTMPALPFLATLPIAFILTAAVGALLE